jgi:Domain of unknown function (DUF5615)
VSGTEGHPNSRPPRFLADENLEKAIVDGVRRRRPDITFRSASEVGTLRLSDQDVLLRAKALDLILISHDRRTMYTHFADLLTRLDKHETSPGVFLVSQERYTIGEIIEFIIEVYDLSEHDEWRNQIREFPV